MTQQVTRRALPFPACSADPVSGLVIDCHDVVIEVACDDGAFLGLVRGQLPPGSREFPGASPDVSYRVDARPAPDGGRLFNVTSCHPGIGESGQVADHEDAASAALFLCRDMEFQVALHAPTSLFVHAAAVAWRERVISLPGQTHSGKSTLTAALVRAGAQYLSDEFTVIDTAGLVHPFHRPVHIRSGGEVHRIPPSSLGAVAYGPMPLGAVVVARFEPGATWHPEAMTPGETALALLDNAVPARVRPAHAVVRIARAIEVGTIGLRGARGEAARAAQEMLDSVDRAWDEAASG